MTTVRGKLTALLVGIASTAVLLACISFVVYDRSSYAEKKQDSMGVLADSVAGAAYGPAAFGDPESTEYVLNTFSAEETAEYGAVYGVDGAILATWSRSEAEVPSSLDNGLEASATYSPNALRVVRPIEKDGERVGTLVATFGVDDIAMRQNRFIAIAGAVLVVSMLVSLGLAMWAQRFFTRQVGELSSAASELAERGSYSVRVKRVSNDELGNLADSFNAMVEAIESRDAKLAGHAQQLETTVAERTEDLRSRNAAIRLILDNIDQGLAVLDSDGKIGVERSAAFDTLLCGPDVGEDFATAMDRMAPGTGECMEVGLQQVFSPILPPEVSLDQLPSTVHLVDGRSLSLAYRAIDGAERRVLTIVSDITEAVRRKDRGARQQQLLAALRRYQEGGSALDDALDEASRIVALATEPTRERTLLLRDLHTLKGNFSVLGLQMLADLAHTLESEVIESGGGLSGSSAIRLRTAWRDFMGELEKVLGDRKQKMLSIPRSEYDAVARPILQAIDGPPARVFQRWGLEANAPRFHQLVEEVNRLGRARRMGIETTVEDDVEYMVSGTHWLWAALPHLVRNAVDHGLTSLGESDRPRKITLRCYRKGDAIEFSVSDNGMGIDWETLRDKGRAIGLAADTKDELLEVLFHDGVSTKTEVTMTSGRGVGLAAVRHDARAHGGDVFIESTPGEGTTFSIGFPMPAPHSLRAA